MTDVVAQARSARECLAKGLGALQSPGVPEHLMRVAEPIARAMSNLHRIESTGGQALVEAAPVALDAVRSALSMLQSAQITHPAVDAAMEAVAGSLGLAHGLSQAVLAAPAPIPAYAAPAPAYAAPAPAYAAPAPVPAAAPAGWGAPPAAAAPAPLFAPMASAAPAQPAPKIQTAPTPKIQTAPVAVSPMSVTAKSEAPPPPPGFGDGTMPNSTLPSSGNVRSPFAPAAADIPFGAGPTEPEAGVLVASQGLPLFEASLGAHSTTNFYKGLSGNDIFDAGGLFVETYKIPSIGSALLLRVSLPGGYEFQAQAVVRWTREPSGSSDGAPGFGAQITQISQEGRQLVHRYIRNREPLFHDDL